MEPLKQTLKYDILKEAPLTVSLEKLQRTHKLLEERTVLLEKLIAPMRKIRPEKSEEVLAAEWLEWYSDVERTILWNVEFPEKARFLDMLVEKDRINDELKIKIDKLRLELSRNSSQNAELGECRKDDLNG